MVERVEDRLGRRLKLEHVSGSVHDGPYAKHYDDEMREFVARTFARDLEEFGYEFSRKRE